MHTACSTPTWTTAWPPDLGKGSTPCTMFLNYTGCLCFSTFATDTGTVEFWAWGPGLNRVHFLSILQLCSRWHWPILPTCHVL